MRFHFLRLPALCVVLSLAIPGSAFAAIKCWTNKEGVRECGNVVPPEYAQKETRTINERGITVEVKERAKTAEELEQERIAKEAEEARVREEKKRQEEQAAYDRMLLSTFTTEADLLASRDRATGAIDATIEISGATITQLGRKLDDLKKRAAGLERAGKPLPDDLKEDMASLERQIADKHEYIATKKQEKARVLEKYEADLQRYRELKSIKPK
ncbi:MAG: hypothetical protein Kow0096_14390 [Thiohalomonadaceae bacterium]